MTLPINHLKRTLDRCCGQWEFVIDPSGVVLGLATFRIRFSNTGLVYSIDWDKGEWTAFSQTKPGYYERCQRLTGILNGHTRDDAGNVSGDGDRRVEGEWQIIVNPPPNLILEKGDEWQYAGEASRWNPIRNVGATIERAFDGCERPIEIRRRIHDPIYETPDKVVI